MVDVGVGVGVMPAPHGNPVNLSLLNRGRQEEDMNRTVVTPETEAARNYPPSWLALTALSTVGNRADHRIGSSSLGGSGGRCSFQQPGNHGGDHLNVTHFLGRDVHDQVFALARHPAVQALEQVPHGNGHLTASAAEQLLQLVHAYTGSGLSGLDSNCKAGSVDDMGSSSPGETRRFLYWCGLSARPLLDPSRALFPSPRPLCSLPLRFLQSAGVPSERALFASFRLVPVGSAALRIPLVVRTGPSQKG